MRHSEFVHLHVHSEYSLLDGAAQLEKLVEKAKELRFPAIALTDHGNLFGAIDFYLAAQKAGVKPILGCELYVAPGGRKERGSQDGGYEGANHLTVLVRNRAGYKNLVKLVSRAFLEGFYYKPRVDRELLAQHADGLLVLSGCLNSEVSRMLSAGDAVRARETAGWYQEVFGKDHYFMEVQAHGLEEQERVMAETLRIAKSIGAPVVGTNDSHYLEGGHARAHEALLCIQTGTNLQDTGRFRFSTQEFYIKSAEEMARVFAELPEACQNTLAVAERCNLTLDFNQFHLPRYLVPDARGQGGDPRRWARARHALRRRRPHREARAELPAEHHARRRLSEVAAAGRDGAGPGERARAVGDRPHARGLHASRLGARLGRRDLRRTARGAHPALQGPQAPRADYRLRDGTDREARPAQDGLPRSPDAHRAGQHGGADQGIARARARSRPAAARRQEDVRDALRGEDVRRVPARVVGHARRASRAPARAARRPDRHGLALPARPDRVHGRLADLRNGGHRQDREVHRRVPRDGYPGSAA